VLVVLPEIPLTLPPTMMYSDDFCVIVGGSEKGKWRISLVSRENERVLHDHSIV